MRLGLVAAVAATNVIESGCFSPLLPAITCTEGVCPSGLVCNDEAECVQRGEQPEIEAAVVDAPIAIDAAIEPLYSMNLLSRWFIDEVQEGAGVPALANAVAGGSSLAINPTDAALIEMGGHRGLAIGRGDEDEGSGGARRLSRPATRSPSASPGPRNSRSSWFSNIDSRRLR